MPIGLDDVFSAGLSLRLGSLANKKSEDLVRRCAGVESFSSNSRRALALQKAEEQELFDVTISTADERELLDQALSAQGEVSGVALPDGVTAQIAKSTMAGLWRVRFSDADDRLVGDYLEVSDIPEIVRRMVNTHDVFLGRTSAKGAMNVMPLLAEIRARVAAFTPGAKSHIVNFMLFQWRRNMSFLQASLGEGPVGLLSRGYGKCRIACDGDTPRLVREYFNAMDEIILDTLEIGGVPVVGGGRGLRNSRTTGFREIYEAYFQ